MSSLSPVLRIGVALGMLLLGVYELLHLLAASASSSDLYSLAMHGALAVLASFAGIGFWVCARWAPAVLLTLAAVFAASRLIDAFVLGIRPWFFAVLAAAVAVALAVALAARVMPARGRRRDEPAAHA